MAGRDWCGAGRSQVPAGWIGRNLLGGRRMTGKRKNQLVDGSEIFWGAGNKKVGGRKKEAFIYLWPLRDSIFSPITKVPYSIQFDGK